MQDNRKLVCLGVDWSNIDQPVLRMASRGSTKSFLLPLQERTLRFQLVDPDTRFCAGWFKLDGRAFSHVNCQTWEVVTTTKQCWQCQVYEGFTNAHQVHRNPQVLRQDVRRYLMQPHYLYVAVFADGSVKVGTVAECRFRERLAEQGAAAATYVMRAADGLVARQAEEAISVSLGINQSLSTRRKLRALSGEVRLERLTSRLTDPVDEARSFIDRIGWAKSLTEPIQWALPACARAAYSFTPVEEYAASLTEGQHSLYVKGVSGSIAVFGCQPDASLLFAGDLSSLRGRELQFGNYHSPDQLVQCTLF